MNRFVDFKEVKAKVRLEEVLSSYGLLETLKRKGDTLTGPCPIHQGKSQTSFKASLSKNIWNCFGPCRGGNVLDFVMQLEQLDIREAALLLNERFLSQGSKPPARRHVGEEVKESHNEAPAPSEVEVGEKRNTPLTFELKNLDPEHTFVARLGFKPETIQHFGAGYCSKGMMRGRVAIPIHNAGDELVAYAGKATRQDQLERYKYPPKFARDLEVYNLHRAEQAAKPIQAGLIVTVDILDVWRLFELGCDNAVALIGTPLSTEQRQRLQGSARARKRLTVLVKDRPVPSSLLIALCQAFYVHLLEVPGWPVKISKEALYEGAG